MQTRTRRQGTCCTESSRDLQAHPTGLAPALHEKKLPKLGNTTREEQCKQVSKLTQSREQAVFPSARAEETLATGGLREKPQ